MVRLTRTQQQERTRVAVLAAAKAEFTEHGYAEAKVDRIAERADLTRGAVYSNFPSKRALYLAVLIDAVERSPSQVPTTSPPSIAAALGGFARTWLHRLPWPPPIPWPTRCNYPHWPPCSTMSRAVARSRRSPAWRRCYSPLHWSRGHQKVM